MEMRDRLIELIRQSCCVDVWNYHTDDFKEPNPIETLADHLIANGVIVPPCKVHDKVYYLNTKSHMALYKNTIYEAKVVRIVTTHLGTCLVIQIRDEFGCCEIPDIRDFGKTVFLTKEEAEAKLKEMNGNG